MKKKLLIIALLAVTVSIGFGSGFYAGAATKNGAGSQNDPVVTLSYLEYRLGKEGTGEDSRGLGAEKVTIERGERLMPGEGSVIVLYSGACTAVGNLIDTTAAKTVQEGETVSPYSQILIPEDSSGVVASQTTVLYVFR